MKRGFASFCAVLALLWSLEGANASENVTVVHLLGQSNPRGTQAREGRALDQPMKAEFRSTHAEVLQIPQHLEDLQPRDLGTPQFAERDVRAEHFEDASQPANMSRRMDAGSEVLPPKKVKSKTLQFNKQDNGSAVVYRQRNHSRQGNQRSRILVQNSTGDQHREIHGGKSLFYDSSAEFLDGTDDQPPLTAPVVTPVVLDGECASRTCARVVEHSGTSLLPDVTGKATEFLNHLPNMSEFGGLAFLSKLANLSYLFDASNPETSTMRVSTTPRFPAAIEADLLTSGSRSSSSDGWESPSAENSTAEAEGRGRGHTARSLFKLLGGQKSSSNSTTADKEGKMSPFRLGLQQLFMPRLPLTYYPQMLAYNTQYPSRAPLQPFYPTHGLTPTITIRAPTTTSAPTSTASETRKSCTGECIDVFAALVCGQVDEEAHCESVNQRCCVKGVEHVSKFFRKHGSVTRAKKSKKMKKNRHKDIPQLRQTKLPPLKDASFEEKIKIAIEEDHRQPELHRVYVHSSTTRTRKPQVHLASGSGIYHVIGSQEVLTTRYPQIPKYVTVVSTTRKPPKQSATRRMDVAESEAVHVSDEKPHPTEESASVPRQKHPQDLNDAELEMIESNVHESEVPPEESRPSQQVDKMESATESAASTDFAPACPGNCVLPIFSFFCDSQHKTSYVCPAGRVCCVAALDHSQNNSRIDDDKKNNNNNNNNNNAIHEDERHVSNCAGRCVPNFLHNLCKLPLRVTNDICPAGSLCCTSAEENHEDDDETNEESEQQDGTAHDPAQDELQKRQDAADAAKQKLNLLHSILTTVLSTKKPKTATESTRRKQPEEQLLQMDEAQLRPSYLQGPKYFPDSEQLTSEEPADPAEVVIEPAIPPPMQSMDTRFLQLAGPPRRFPPLPHQRPIGRGGGHAPPPSLEHRQRNSFTKASRVPVRPENYEVSRPHHYPLHPGLRWTGPYPPYSHRERLQSVPRRGVPPAESPEVSLEEEPQHLPGSSEETLADEGRGKLHREGQREGQREGAEFAEQQRDPLPPPSSLEEGNFSHNPFLTEWLPRDLDVARVKEVNAASLSPDIPEVSEGPRGVHPSSCGLNGFHHIKRWNSDNEAHPGEWCWQAAIVDGDDRLLCSGAVIGAQWVVTSASCVANYSALSPPALRVKIGYANMAAGLVGSQTKTVSLVYSHHNFNARSRENDVALLKLQDFIELNGVVCVICLPSILRPGTATKGCTVTAYREEANSGFRLVHERVSKLDSQVCVDLASLKNSTAEASAGPRTKFCAGEVALAEREGVCDTSHLGARRKPTMIAAGGPLVCRVDDFYQLSGISSSYLGCEQLATPSYFTNLAYFTGWINQITNVNRYS